MKDLRIVIVSWNVSDLLGQCLKSLRPACEGLDWECVVVDNASSDNSAEIAKDFSKHEPRISLLWNESNLGFAKACNQGAKGADARYVLFLNCDTDCPPGSLAKLVQVADSRPKAGILGPKLTFADGRYQPSVRRFPGVWDQALIVLKLQYLFPHLRVLEKYYAKDFDHDKEQSVDQVMGACFLVRRELLDKELGFDERYFFWMEEVDFCKTARTNGYDVLYVPSVTVIHHLSQSVAKEFQLQRQRYFLTSLKKYFSKWHPGWKSHMISALAPVGFAVVWLANLSKKPIVFWTAAVVALEIVSALTIFNPLFNSIFCVLLGLTIFVLGWRKPAWGLSALLLELMIGSKGYILQLGVWPNTISLRIIMTLAFLLGWSVHFLKNGKTKELIAEFNKRPAYACLFLVLIYAFLRGLWLHNQFALKDANAWGDWLLIFPVLDVALRQGRQLRRAAVPAMFVGIFWLALKTIGLEYLFSHGFSAIASDLYVWVRRTGVGEVTLIAGNVFRIFMQSYVYSLPALILAVGWWMCDGMKVKDYKSKTAGFIILSVTVMLAISLSRSFWIGAFAGLVVLIALVWRSGIKWWKKLLLPISAGAAGVILLAVVLAFPIPHINTASLFDIFSSRTNLEEPAAVSRWHLLPVLAKKILEHPILGSGFGAAITYQSADPRILKGNPSGMYTTYAFEWGWLEHWIKFGILGIPLILWILISLGSRLWKTDEPLWLRAGAVASLVALAVLHMFTPYLNHPLGFAFLFLGEGLIASSIKPLVPAQKF